MHIKNLMIRTNIGTQEVSSILRELQKDSRGNKVRNEADKTGDKEVTPQALIGFKNDQNFSLSNRHPHRRNQVQSHTPDNCDIEPKELDSGFQNTAKCIQQSRKERRAFNQKNKTALLHNTRSGKVAFKPVTKKPRNGLHAIPTDTLSVYINDWV